MSPGKLTVGTSGFSYGHWREVFYPPGTPTHRWLEYYASRFRSVELNVTFYRLPPEVTFEQWAARTPADFEFVVKGSRTITHYRRLDDVDEQLHRLFESTAALGRKLGCFLWQLPPRFHADGELLAHFCDSLAEKRGHDRHPVRHAFEFREGDWFEPDIADVLREHGHALVLAQPGVKRQPVDSVTADFAYLRFHHGEGPGGGFVRGELEPWAARAASYLARGMDVYAFFNNDPGGWAPKDADTFAALVADAF